VKVSQLAAGLLIGGTVLAAGWYAVRPVKGASAASMASHGIAGFWQGTLDTGAVPLRLVFKIEKKPDESMTGTLDSIDQGAKGIALSAVSLKGDAVRFEVNIVSGVYEGKLSADGSQIIGVWKQGPAALPLSLKHADKVAELRRPQEPKPPYPYLVEEVAYDNKQGGSHLAGTLTLPRTGGPFPAALLITGSGQQDRDEALMGHRPFLVLADYLTRRGIAVLRVDDRGVGGSSGDVEHATTEDFAGDVLAGMAYLKTRKEIDPQQIGLIGHSEGGVIAPMCAARSKDVAFIVMLAGTGLPGEEILYRQGELILKAMGASPAMIAQQRTAQERLFAVLKQEKDNKRAEKALRKVYAELLVHPAPDAAKAAAGTKPEAEKTAEALPAGEEASLQSMLWPWFRFFLTYDPRPALKQVKCPVLAINGAKDLQAPPKEDLREIAAALKAGGNRDYTVRELPGLNHLFQTARTGAPAEYGQIEETFSPVALKVIGDWIVQRTGAGKKASAR
jgi:pimeloyl-ACP methyl ester carboxylesterase